MAVQEVHLCSSRQVQEVEVQLVWGSVAQQVGQEGRRIRHMSSCSILQSPATRLCTCPRFSAGRRRHPLQAVCRRTWGLSLLEQGRGLQRAVGQRQRLLPELEVPLPLPPPVPEAFQVPAQAAEASQETVFEAFQVPVGLPAGVENSH